MTDISNATAVPTVAGKLPGLGHVLQFVRRPLEFVQSLPTVGDLAWIYLGRQPVLTVNTPALVHQMLVTDGRKYDQGKYFDKIRDTFGNGLPVSNGEFHQKQRRLIQPAFHRDRIAAYVEVIGGLANTMAESWRPGDVVPLKQDSLQLMLSMVAKTLFSSDVGDRVRDEVRRSWTTVVKGLAWRSMAPTDLLEKLPTPGNRRYDRATNGMRRVVADAVSEQRGAGGDDGSLLSMLLSARDADTGEGMSDEQISAEIFLILFAGSETAGFMMAWLFYQLSLNPAMEAKLHEEVDAVLAGRQPTLDDLGKLSYTRRLLTECLRLYHPGWMFMRRTNTTVELGGLQFPPGTETLFSIYAMHRDPRWFPDPLRFDPDRWLPGTPQPPEGAYIPFLTGKRQCIGDAYAWAQMTATVAAIASRWRMTPVTDGPPQELAQALMNPSEVAMTVSARH